MPWFTIRPRDPADPRWPLTDRPDVVIEAADPDEARARFAQAYRSVPFGTPGLPVPDSGSASIHDDDDAVVVTESGPPPTTR